MGRRRSEWGRSAIWTAIVIVIVTAPAAAWAQMTDAERKASARAAYGEGITLEEAGKTADALSRFEAAQRLYDAPTHLLHIAICQAKLGRLVEAAEAYEALTRKQLPPDAPNVFVEAQSRANAALPEVRKRIPTLRVTVGPDPRAAGLALTINGRAMPVELVGIARPINPGTYHLSATATGLSASPVDVTLMEGERKSAELTLVAARSAPGTYDSPTTTPNEATQPTGSSQTGLLLGARLGVVVPTGSLTEGRSFQDAAKAGPGFGLDASLRIAKGLLIGGTFEYAKFTTPDRLPEAAAATNASASVGTIYVGPTLGIISAIDKVSFIGDVGLGARFLSRSIDVANVTAEESFSGVEFALSAGFSIPAGNFRVIPRFGLNIGSFSSTDLNCDSAAFPCDKVDNSAPSAGHTILFASLGLRYSLDLGKR